MQRRAGSCSPPPPLRRLPDRPLLPHGALHAQLPAQVRLPRCRQIHQPLRPPRLLLQQERRRQAGGLGQDHRQQALHRARQAAARHLAQHLPRNSCPTPSSCASRTWAAPCRPTRSRWVPIVASELLAHAVRLAARHPLRRHLRRHDRHRQHHHARRHAAPLHLVHELRCAAHERLPGRGRHALGGLRDEDLGIDTQAHALPGQARRARSSA